MLADALEVHRVVYLIFAAEHLFEREVVMPFLQRIERYLFVVFGESVPGPSCACSGASIVRGVEVLLCHFHRRFSRVVRLLALYARIELSANAKGRLIGRHFYFFIYVQLFLTKLTKF